MPVKNAYCLVIQKLDQVLYDILIRGILHHAEPTMQYFMIQWVLEAWCNCLYVSFPTLYQEDRRRKSHSISLQVYGS